LNISSIIGIITGIIVIIILFILSVISWELFKRDFQ